MTPSESDADFCITSSILLASERDNAKQQS